MNKPSKSKSDIEEHIDASIRKVMSSVSGKDIIARMEAMQQPFDAQAAHESDLRYESRVDYESWETDQQEAE